MEKIHSALDNRINTIASREIGAYVSRIVGTFDQDRLNDALQHTNVYISKIKQKIDSLLEIHTYNEFWKQVDAKKISALPSYSLPDNIAPTESDNKIIKSLYKAEDSKMNDFEWNFIKSLASLDNVRWWRRIRERKPYEFYINGFINHYPDFLVMTEKGIIMLVETKGDDRDNSDSERKLKLGKQWEAMAGISKYSYFMVFDKNPIEGAQSVDGFMSLARKL